MEFLTDYMLFTKPSFLFPEKKEAFVLEVPEVPGVPGVPEVPGVLEVPEVLVPEVPDRSDTLFWCLFQAKYGRKEESHLKGRIEQKEKDNVAQFLCKKQTWKDLIGIRQSSVVCSANATDLLTKKNTPVSSLFGFCAFYEFSFLVIDPLKRIYLSFIYRETPPMFAIYKHKKIFQLDQHFKPHHVKNYISIEWDKPLKGISAYKKIDLEEMFKKLKQDSSDKKKKELYDSISELCAWKKN